MTKSRGRTLGLDFPGTPGTDNAITDVAGVAVGYTTVIEGVRRNVPYLVLDLPHIWSSKRIWTLKVDLW